MIRLFAGGAGLGIVGLLAVTVATALIALKLSEAMGLAPPHGEEE